MNIRTSLIRTTTTAIGCAIAIAQAAQAQTAQDAASMSVDARTPVHATLLQTVIVNARASHPGAGSAAYIVDKAALAVTLLPTVYVTARMPAFAAVENPSDAIVERTLAVDAAGSGFARNEAERDAASSRLRARVMPR